jgi:hypothetical protein
MNYFDKYLDIIDCVLVKVYELKAACEPDAIHRSHQLITSKIAARQR